MHVTLEDAAKMLIAGKVVAVPTETVYGLAACVSNASAVAEIFSLKGRPANNPLIIHLSNADQTNPYAESIPSGFRELAERFWPGPLTIILPIKKESVPECVRAGLPTAAFRVPNHPLARALIDLTGPLVMPSANLSGRPSSTCAQHVESDFGDHFPVLDGGECLRGVESTILYWNAENGRWMVGRLGAIAPEDFSSVLGYIPEQVKVEKGKSEPICPGQLYRHYAPKAKLHLSRKIAAKSGEVVIGFEDREYPEGVLLISLGRSDDPEMAAQKLYAILRRLDQEGVTVAFVDVNFPDDGLWITLRERLNKAAGG